MKFTLRQFNAEYPDDDACLEVIWQQRFGDDWVCARCLRTGSFTRVRKRMCYACTCGNQIYPLAKTIFRKTTTPLRDWFYVMYLMTQTRGGISAKQIEREIGCTYKTAWRMMRQVRILMADDPDEKFEGDVEIDETFFKAKPYRDSRIPKGRKAFFSAPAVFGVIERSTGRAKVRVLPNMRSWTIRDFMLTMVRRGSVVHSDGSRSYELMRYYYKHISRVHWGEYIPGESHFQPAAGDSTQQIENLWGNMKRGILGVYRHVGPQYLQDYANEYAWRYSHRRSSEPLFHLLMARLAHCLN